MERDSSLVKGATAYDMHGREAQCQRERRAESRRDVSGSVVWCCCKASQWYVGGSLVIGMVVNVAAEADQV
ncbi:unnamed protein product [Ectocarpus sp. 4 AP-2014]